MRRTRAPPPRAGRAAAGAPGPRRRPRPRPSARPSFSAARPLSRARRRREAGSGRRRRRASSPGRPRRCRRARLAAQRRIGLTQLPQRVLAVGEGCVARAAVVPGRGRSSRTRAPPAARRDALMFGVSAQDVGRGPGCPSSVPRRRAYAWRSPSSRFEAQVRVSGDGSRCASMSPATARSPSCFESAGRAQGEGPRRIGGSEDELPHRGSACPRGRALARATPSVRARVRLRLRLLGRREPRADRSSPRPESLAGGLHGAVGAAVAVLSQVGQLLRDGRRRAGAKRGERRGRGAALVDPVRCQRRDHDRRAPRRRGRRLPADAAVACRGARGRRLGPRRARCRPEPSAARAEPQPPRIVIARPRLRSNAFADRAGLPVTR